MGKAEGLMAPVHPGEILREDFIKPLGLSVILNQELVRILSPAYKCPEFKGACKEMRWSPKEGHIPRGFRGATGKLSEVELVLVFAEPGDPFDHGPSADVRGVHGYSTETLRNGETKFHKNIRKILDLCWPNTPFDEQMKRVWLTESVLCSAHKECGRVPREVELVCAERYLLKELDLFKNALIVAMGRKAERRIKQALTMRHEHAVAAAPPAGNTSKAVRSWKRIAKKVKER